MLAFHCSIRFTQASRRSCLIPLMNTRLVDTRQPARLGGRWTRSKQRKKQPQALTDPFIVPPLGAQTRASLQQWQEMPLFAASCGVHNCSVLADGRPGSHIYEGNRQKIFRRAAKLLLPGLAAIGGPQNTSMPANEHRGAFVR